MSSNFDQIDGDVRPQRSLLSLMLVPLIAFVAGIAAMGWLLSRWAGGASILGLGGTAAPPPPTAPTVMARPVATPAPTAAGEGEPQRLVIDPEISRRVTRLEGRIVQIDSQTRAAVGNADRAEGLLVAFAARRALDRGVALGYIEGLLRQRFGDTQPQAVATIITASRQPVTLQELQDGMQEVSPDLLGGGPQQSWWDALKGEFDNLITIRKAGTPSTIPAERLRRAARRIEAGDVDVALAEVLRLPERQNAREWIVKARRYVAARRALDTIETAALLEPRALSAPEPPPARLTGTTGPG